MARPRNLRRAGALLSAACLASPAAHAQTNEWKFEASLYGWIPEVSGTTTVLPNGSTQSISVSKGDVLAATNITFQGHFEARRGRWGIWTDLIYTDFSESQQNSRSFTVNGAPVSFDANLRLDVRSWIWTQAGQYTLQDDSERRMDVLFGARMLRATNGLSWSLNTSAGPGLPPLTGSAEDTLTYWDAVVGLKGRVTVGAERRWFFPYYVDVGTGDSKLTWQLNTGVGYQYNWGALVATWRYLDYTFKSSSPLQDETLSGPVIGAAFKF